MLLSLTEPTSKFKSRRRLPFPVIHRPFNGVLLANGLASAVTVEQLITIAITTAKTDTVSSRMSTTGEDRDDTLRRRR
jgi:hypothetical protein